MTLHRLTESEIARRTGEPVAAVSRTLAQLEQDGLADHGPEGWRLTTAAELELGHALRELRKVET